MPDRLVDPTAELAQRAAEIMARCDLLAAATEQPGRLTRTFLSPPMRRVHAQLAGWMERAGMTVRVDAAGNLFGRHEAESGRADAPVLLIGSHLDTVPDAGRYDGPLGVLLGVAAVERLRGRRLAFAVEVVGFSEEEGVRFRTPYLGSLAVAGRFDPSLLDLEDADGIRMADAFQTFGLDPARVGEAAYPPGRIIGYVEAHIEQGPVLAGWGSPVGIVSGIVGQSRLDTSFEGVAGHAGTMPMEGRRDALTAASEWVLEVENLARSVPGLRGTVGSIVAVPGATNVVPGLVRLSLDLRHAEDLIRQDSLKKLREKAIMIATRRDVIFRVERAQDLPAVPADAELSDLLAEAVAGSGVAPRRLVSGAGHDAAVMGQVAPMTMLFVRSPNGISHHPDEQVEMGDVQVAMEVLGRFLDAWGWRGC